MTSSPLKVVKDRFGDKEKLVAAVEKLATDELWLDRINSEKGLARVSNAKLLRLHDALSKTKEEFGSRGKLVEAILDLEKRTKDEGYKGRLSAYSTPRLLDLHRAAARRKKASEARAAKPATAATPKKKKARSKKAQAKARGK